MRKFRQYLILGGIDSFSFQSTLIRICLVEPDFFRNRWTKYPEFPDLIEAPSLKVQFRHGVIPGKEQVNFFVFPSLILVASWEEYVRYPCSPGPEPDQG